MLLAQEFATGQSGIGYTQLDWKCVVPTLAFRWRDGIIEPVVPYLQQHNIRIFQNDNARPHTARHTQNILHIHNINVLQWPARSLDLSPIEHLLDHVGRQVREGHDVNNIHYFECALQAEWPKFADLPRAKFGYVLYSLFYSVSVSCVKVFVCETLLL